MVKNLRKFFYLGIGLVLFLGLACSEEEVTRELPEEKAPATTKPQTNKEKIQAFWSWFESHGDSLKLNLKTETWQTNLRKEIKSIHPDLVYTIVAEEENKLTLFVSPEGVKELFPLVDSVVDGAPEMKDWQIKALRPVLGIGPVEVSGIVTRPTEVYFTVAKDKDPEKIAVTFYLFSDFFIDYERKVFNEQKIQGLWLMIDNAIGEAVAEEVLGLVDYKQINPDDKASAWLKFEQIPEVVRVWKEKKTLPAPTS